MNAVSEPVIAIQSAAEFHQHLASPELILADFWAPWCAPCRALLPVLERVTGLLAGQVRLLKINADDLPQLAEQYQVRSLPTVLLLKQGQVLDRFSGLLSESQLKAFLDPYVVHPYDLLLQQALQSESPRQSLKLLRQAYAIAPDKGVVVAALVNTLLDLALPDQALGDQLAGDQAADYVAEASAMLAAAGPEQDREPEMARARSRLHLLQKLPSGVDAAQLRKRFDSGDVSAAIPLAVLLAHGNNSEQALELLLSVIAQQTAPAELIAQARSLMVDLLNTLSDRELAHRYRRQLFALPH